MTTTVKQLVADLEKIDVYEFPIDKIHFSSSNPRQVLDMDKLKSLATNIAAVGVQQAVLLRPHPTKPGEAEQVFGERRVRAAKMAGLKTVPARLRELTTLEVLELQAYENGQRDDIHPLEEADHFMRMHKPPKGADYPPQSIGEIMAKSGKSRSSVFAALKLCELSEVGRKLFLEGKFSKSVAYLVAQIYPPKVQDAAAREIGRGGDDMTFRDAFDHVKRNYTLALEGSGFDTADAKLVEKAGPCTTCPKRSGSQLELLGDAKKPDVCMDRVCFKAKQDAAWAIRSKIEAEKGATVVDDKKAKELFPHGQLSYNAPYVDLDAECYEDPKNRKYKSLIPKDAPVIVARDPRGQVHRLVEKKELPALMKAAGVKIESRVPSSSNYSAQDKARKAALEKRRTVVHRVIGEVAEKIPGGDPFYRLLLEAMAKSGYHDAVGEVCKRRGWTEKGKRPETIFFAKIRELTGAALPRLAMELAISRHAYGTYSTTIGEHVTKAAKLAGVNIKKIEKAVAAELAEKKKRKRAKKAAVAVKAAA